ncbi:unnamed protein product [Urochloa humidicola]
MSFTGVSYVGDSTLSPPAASVATAVTFSGYHLLVVHGYSGTKEDTPNGKCLESDHVKVGGHRWVIKYFPNGYKEKHSGYISFYLVLDEDNIIEPVIVHYEFNLVDQFQNQEFSLLTGKRGTLKFSNRDAWSPRCYMKIEELERSKHLKNDSFMIRCDIVITKDVIIGDVGAATKFVVVPPPDIQLHLHNLLRSQEGTDVTFQVGGEMFAAHRCVLSARSDVFKAELFGPMKEGTKHTIVCIKDIETKVFRLLLDFIYSDSVPEIEEEDEEFMWQHLLVAADKYDLLRLRLICEQKLCKYITVSTVATILEFAEQHQCQGLKGACLDFLTSPANLKEVTAAGGLDHMISSCPSVLKEFIAKLVLLKDN